jgi:hypothetical protein
VSVTIPGPNETGPRVAQAVRQIAAGGTNARNTLTLVAGQTSTVVADDLAAEGATVFLCPRTAAAAAAGAWLSAMGAEQFTLSHPAAAAGCTFDYEIRR